MAFPPPVRTVLTTGLALALAAPVLAVTSAVPATAADQIAPLRPSAEAPACVKRKVNKWKWRVEVRNNCTYTLHLKVIMVAGNNSGCRKYAKGQRRDHYVNSLHLDSVRIC